MGRWYRRLFPIAKIVFVCVAVAPLLLIALFRFVDPPITPLMVIRWLDGASIKRSWQPLERISPHLGRTVIAAEDNLFCRHWGFDVDASWEQVKAWLDGERPRGASTITMQTAKNLFLWPERSMYRKLLEAWLTPQIELIWPKRRTLEVYLNIVEFDSGVYGAEAAALHHFAVAASELDLSQSTRLAAVLPNPRAWSASKPSPWVSQRADTIRHRVNQLGRLIDCVPG